MLPSYQEKKDNADFFKDTKLKKKMSWKKGTYAIKEEWNQSIFSTVPPVTTSKKQANGKIEGGAQVVVKGTGAGPLKYLENLSVRVTYLFIN